MSAFEFPADITYNRGAIGDVAAFAEDAAAESWLYLCGTEFAEMEGGMAYSDVQAAVPVSENIVSDPPRELTVDLARQHVAALDRLPRPTAITCRAGPRASAIAYLYAGLRSGVSAEEVLARADADQAPFATFPEYRDFLIEAMAALVDDV